MGRASKPTWALCFGGDRIKHTPRQALPWLRTGDRPELAGEWLCHTRLWRGPHGSYSRVGDLEIKTLTLNGGMPRRDRKSSRRFPQPTFSRPRRHRTDNLRSKFPDGSNPRSRSRRGDCCRGDARITRLRIRTTTGQASGGRPGPRQQGTSCADRTEHHGDEFRASI